ncbi:MAG: phosphate transporter substrate-binding protein, PhoT family [Proteobacteria bacterium]|nr:phosphate transporter substrate-binding protein, PhoT family [Pseudomonadota bacterium]
MLVRLSLLILALMSGLASAADDLVIIGHSAVPKADRVTLQRLFSGRIVSISQQSVMPINLPAGHPARDEFLQWIMEQNEEQYTGYWLVRRYVGKGSPPQELGSIDEVVKYIGATPGAVGYVPASRVPPGGNVIFRR